MIIKESKMAEEEKKKEKKKKKGEEVPESRPLRTPKSRLAMQYETEVIPSMMKEFGWNNKFQVPRVEKVIVSMGVGEGSRDIKVLESAMKDIEIIAGQKPVMTRARKSVAQYKLREGMPLGTFVTLRGNRMYEFMDRLFNIALPRVRDFQGLNPNSFDGTGNFTMGIHEQLVFPEIDYDEIDRVRGMDITFVTSARNDAQALSLLKFLGCPFRSTSA